MVALPTHAQVRELIEYDPETGVFRWRARPPSMFSDGAFTAEQVCKSWNARNAEREAGTANPVTGRRTITILGRRVCASHLAVFYMTEKWPAREVDHRDRNPGCDAWNNLREASPSHNQANQGLSRHNTSGVKGVSWFAKRNKWRAVISINNRQLHIGLFADKNAAKEAYDNAARLFYGDFAHTNADIEARSA